jgi:hypothetical protein
MESGRSHARPRIGSSLIEPSMIHGWYYAGNMGWAFWASTSTPKNRSPKHGPVRNNMNQASMARCGPRLGLEFWPVGPSAWPNKIHIV